MATIPLVLAFLLGKGKSKMRNRGMKIWMMAMSVYLWVLPAFGAVDWNLG
jgi:uncharacterized membrane protein